MNNIVAGKTLFGGIEAGGTKFVCTVAGDPPNILNKNVQNILNGYLNNKMLLDNIDRYIVPPSLGNRAGVLGAIALAVGHQ